MRYDRAGRSEVPTYSAYILLPTSTCYKNTRLYAENIPGDVWMPEKIPESVFCVYLNM